MAESYHLDNYGYIIEDVPPELFQRLKVESLTAEQERYFPTDNAREMVSGLSGPLCPKHYYVDKNKDELNKFVLDLFATKYEPKFNYLSNFKTLTHSVPIIAHTPWINIQEKNEMIPNHQHDGIVSYALWIKIPYNIDDEAKQGEFASCFQFTYSSIVGGLHTYTLRLDKAVEGKIMMFPAQLQHCVYPFTTVDDCRISISGNVSFDTSGVTNAS